MQCTEIEIADDSCRLCKYDMLDYKTFGPFMRIGRTYVHSLCVVLCDLANGMAQEDSKIFDGVTEERVIRRAQETDKIRCIVCCKYGATFKCANENCLFRFHFPCAVLQNFCINFISNTIHCRTHMPHWRELVKTMNLIRTVCCCPVCSNEVNAAQGSLQLPCCNYVIHLSCLKSHTFIWGHLSRCPRCNSADEFRHYLMTNGVSVQFAVSPWDSKVNEYSTILAERYAKCGASICKCPFGREFRDGQWNVINCYKCLRSAIHLHCFVSRGNEYTCASCLRV